jgi:hypothetical protein
MIAKFSSCFLVAMLLCGCGGATTGAQPEVGGVDEDELTRPELAKLDEQLRARVEARDAPFPVRVTFASLPSTSDLAALMLVRYERVAIGRVDLPTLKVIAARDDVRRITLLTGVGYQDDGGA